MANDFSLEKFQEIKPGMDSLAVFKLLGKPLFIRHDTVENKLFQIRFEYTSDGKLLQQMKRGDQTYEDYAWYNAVVTLNPSGKVERSGGGWCYD
ncbi:MAG TPA: hypothetical protein VK177_04680 [Flavobacteriales bacterium]|nr:hypothetical protein [Flavobacteriales bacterium]